MELFLVHLDPSRPPTQYKVTCPKNGTMADLCLALSQLAKVQVESLVVTDVYNHRFYPSQHSSVSIVSLSQVPQDIQWGGSGLTDPGQGRYLRV